VTDTGEEAMGKRPPTPPTPPPEKVKEKHFRENLTPTEQIPKFPRVSDIQIYLESFLH